MVQEIDIVEIARQIKLKDGKTDYQKNRKEYDWRPIRVDEYIVPSFVIPKSRNYANTKRQLSKVLAFIDLNK